MNHYVADTHALFWYLTRSSRLGTQAKAAFDEGAAGTALIHIPVIVLAELCFLNEKAGHPLDFAAEFNRLSQAGQFLLIPLLPQDILDLDATRNIPEMHDRMIVALAHRLGATCLTKDTEIAASGLVPVKWA